jgi:NADH-quinone oxidoreductase subunit N
LNLFLPEISLAAFAILVILVDLFVRNKAILAVLSIAGLLVSAILTLTMWNTAPQSIFGNNLAVDNFAMVFKLLFDGIAILVILASFDYVGKMERFQGEYFALILLSTLGMILMSSATDLITIYVAIELTVLPICVLVALMTDQKSTEAGLKYVLLSATISAVLLFGMALVFGVTGKTQIGEIAAAISAPNFNGANSAPNFALLAGIVLIIAGFGFKIAAVPFHMWVPDVYEGAPTPITAYLSVGSKAAGFAVIIRVFSTAFGEPAIAADWGMIFAILAAITMTVGNVLAIPQTNIKRMLGYSSIAQAGYIMVGLAAIGLAPGASITGQNSVAFFLISYALTNLGAFIAIIAISNKINSDEIKDFAGMIKRAPVLTLALTICLLSLIGMPPAAGFMAKFYVFTSGAISGLMWLIIIALVNTAISAYYYLRVAKIMWFGEPASNEGVPSSLALQISLSISCVGVLLLGIIPGVVMKVTAAAAKLFVLK